MPKQLLESVHSDRFCRVQNLPTSSVELIWPITELYFRQILSTDFMNRFYQDVNTGPYCGFGLHSNDTRIQRRNKFVIMTTVGSRSYGKHKILSCAYRTNINIKWLRKSPVAQSTQVRRPQRACNEKMF